MAETEYQKHPRATVNRLKARGKYDYDTIHSLIDNTPVLHVAFPARGVDPFPAILPMLGCTGNFDVAAGQEEIPEPTAPGSFPPADGPRYHPPPPGPRSIYLHGHVASRLFKYPTADDPLPVCVAATGMQGIVLALTPFHNSCNYASAVVHGWARPVTDEAERMYALTLITDNLVTGRWDNSRVPSAAELKSTGMLRVDVESASAKVRIGGPSDDRADVRNEELVDKTWTGTVPVWMMYGEPVEGGYNKVKSVPPYLKEWIDDVNGRNKKLALDATTAG